MKRIISASYKNDIPAFGSEEFFQNLRNGYVETWTKFGKSRISLLPEDVYCIVFWTKNTSDHFLQNMRTIQSPWYIQWTITGYENDVEPNVPAKHIVLQNFRYVASLIGPERTMWRYDPIFISDKYTVNWHKKMFANLCAQLHGYTERCTISFLDEYGKIAPLVKAGVMRAPTLDEIHNLAEDMAKEAALHGITIQTCSEGQYDLTAYGIKEAPCVDADFIERTFGIILPDQVKKPNSFRRCLCAINTDIGAYHTCKHNCAYCYAK